MNILVINAGSSSLKYQLMDPDTGVVTAKGLCERIGLDGRLNHKVIATGKKLEKDIPMPTHKEAIESVMDILVDAEYGVIKSVDEIDAVGHRVLHGGDKFVESCIVTDACKETIRECIPLGPLHNPANLMGIEACEKAMPGKPQVAVFDTAFHMTMPPKAYRYAIPTKYYTEDHLRRYGFHGTSHRFVSKRCIELMGGVENAHRVIVCHLGNGSSLSAVKDGKCQDTSMGLSPLAGVPMGTRAGDIDTCVAQFIMNKYNMSADDCLTMLNKKSGVLALSDGISSDFRDLDKAAEEGNEAAQLALDKFAYEVRKYIGAYTAALGGLDCLVFTAGVGENSASMRASICEGLECLGVKLDAEKNKTRGEEAVISADDSKVKVWVIPTNEELMIALDVKELLARVHAVMRRTDADAPVEKKLTFDKLVINLESYELIVDGVKIDTPPKEMELLYHLAASPNRVFTRNQLLDEVWGFDYFGDSRTVDVHVKRLREKLEGVSDKWCLKTVWGVGYKFEVHE